MNPLQRLRTAAIVATVAGAAGSVALTLYAGRNNQHVFLTALFVVWVLSPFAALLRAAVVARRWLPLTEMSLYSVMLVLPFASLTIYAADVFGPPHPQAAFVFVIVPPVSWLVLAIVVPTSALLARRLSRKG